MRLEIGIKYSDEQLDKIFDFCYKGSAGIKESQLDKDIIILFSNLGAHQYPDKEENGVIYYTRQNTGGKIQHLKYGNKKLYDAYDNDKIKIYFFKNYVYHGEYIIIKKPYQADGKWIFPIQPKQ
jgi:hypothetical protein